jgi:hypothetical protein
VVLTCPEHHSICATGDFLAGLVFQSGIISPQGSCWSTVTVGEAQEIVRDEIPAAPTTLLAEIVSNGLLVTPPIVRGGDHAQPGFFCLMKIDSASVRGQT